MNFRYTDDVNGTCLRGYVRTTYSNLLKAFGSPNIGRGDKTTAEWGLKFEDGTVATIYDWKEPLTPTEEYFWHVGGFNNRAVHRVCAVLGTMPEKYF